MRTLRTIFITLFSTLVFGLLTVYDGFQLSAQSNQNNAETQSTQEIPEVIYDPELLPEKVAKTRKLILEAARTGDLESLRPVLEDSELKPVISFENVDDPIAYWRSQSADGKGYETLAKIAEIFNAGFVRVNKDTPEEMYIWPYFAAVPIKSLTPTQKVELYQLLPHSKIIEMESTGKYNDLRAGIDRAGVWHYFVSDK